MLIVEMILSREKSHFSAEDIHDELNDRRHVISLATIYNTLHEFSERRIIRTINILINKTIYDRDIGNHIHFIVEDTKLILDAFGKAVLKSPPICPAGMEIAYVDLALQLRF
ncbi:Fur family transcriptional regulator [Labrys sp. KB_33_2]|uniref:Fur family transcriptional regulator n=1 Tax=Labrys sp. KB_33_2 TaxID=3237479 RepID=UPI003F9086AF